MIWTCTLIGGPLHGVKREGRLSVAIVEWILHFDKRGSREYTYRPARISKTTHRAVYLYSGWKRAWSP